MKFKNFCEWLNIRQSVMNRLPRVFKKRNLIVKVEFNLKADTPNANGTIYPKDILKEAIKEYNENYVKKGRALGELGQPINAMIDTSLTNIAFKVNEIEFKDDHWNAEIEIFETPKGKELQEIIKHDEYRIVTVSYGEVTENKDGTRTLNNMDITGVGIEPKDNCA